MNSRLRRGELLLALGVIVLAALLAWQVTEIQVSPTYSRIGPRIFPIAICIALAAVGVLLAVETLTATDEPVSAEQVPTDYAAIGFLLAGLIAQTLLLEPLGFVFSSAIMFVLATVGFGSCRILRNAGIGLVLAAVIYLGFTRGLQIGLPAGLLAGIV